MQVFRFPLPNPATSDEIREGTVQHHILFYKRRINAGIYKFSKIDLAVFLTMLYRNNCLEMSSEVVRNQEAFRLRNEYALSLSVSPFYYTPE